MHLFKSGNKYYLSKSGSKYYGWEDDYIISNGQLKWCSPDIYLQNDASNYIDTGYVAQNNTAIIVDFRVDNVRDISSNTRNWICGSSANYANPGNFYGGFWFQGEAASGSRFWLNTTSLGAGNSGSVSSANFILNKYRLILASPYNINYRNSGNNGSYSTITQIDNELTIFTKSNSESNWGNISMTTTLFNRKSIITSTNVFLLGKIYTTTIMEDNNLIMKLVPVPTNLQIGSFTVPSNGMFDIVNQQFYANQGTGTFTYGKDS